MDRVKGKYGSEEFDAFGHSAFLETVRERLERYSTRDTSPRDADEEALDIAGDVLYEEYGGEDPDKGAPDADDDY